jgi:hypothetical protein
MKKSGLFLLLLVINGTMLIGEPKKERKLTLMQRVFLLAKGIGCASIPVLSAVGSYKLIRRLKTPAQMESIAEAVYAKHAHLLDRDRINEHHARYSKQFAISCMLLPVMIGSVAYVNYKFELPQTSWNCFKKALS